MAVGLLLAMLARTKGRESRTCAERPASHERAPKEMSDLESMLPEDCGIGVGDAIFFPLEDGERRLRAVFVENAGGV